MTSLLANVWNVLLIVIGFGLVIVVHELGHFVAARWAGIRVMAFAVGFGSAVCSWRKGMGFRWGSSEKEYLAIAGGGTEAERSVRGKEGVEISPTEYRLNWFPFGGYVKMLGQDDLHPASANAMSAARDSYAAKPVWKRMVVISAGVVMNLILAAVLFVVVFMAGMRDVPAVVGMVEAGSPAERAGLRAGDVITRIEGEEIETFKDVMIAAAMARRGQALDIRVERWVGRGAWEEVELRATPEVDERGLGLLHLGVYPAASGVLFEEGETEEEKKLLREAMARAGLEGVPPGARLLDVNGEPVEPVRVAVAGRVQEITVLDALTKAIERSGGAPVRAGFSGPTGEEVRVELLPSAKFDTAMTLVDGAPAPFGHLAGFVPVMKVGRAEERARKQGLRDGDVFARIGSREWPNIAAGISEIRAHRGRMIELDVVRGGELVRLTASVSAKGVIGFGPDEAFDHGFVTSAPELAPGGDGERGATAEELPAWRIVPGVMPGMKLVAAEGKPVRDYSELRAAMRGATARAAAEGEGATVRVEVKLLDPWSVTQGTNETLAVEMTAEEVRRLHELGWQVAGLGNVFRTAEIEMKARTPVGAVMMGVEQTRRVMMMTYVTFLRLFEGTVKVEHLKGPVGIAHVGSQFAAQGMVYLLFFLALISANLAVINFLPMPIVDGGAFVLLAIEGITKRPVPVVVQNALTMAGIVLIGTVFLVVTFHDVVGLMR